MTANPTRAIGKYSLLTTLCFVTVVAAFRLLDLHASFFGTQTPLYGIYNTLKALLLVLILCACASAGRFALGVVGSVTHDKADRIPPLLLQICVGMFATQLATWPMGVLGLFSWQVLLPCTAVLLLFSNASLEACTGSLARWPRAQMHKTTALLRNAIGMHGVSGSLARVERLSSALLRVAFTYQYLVLFLIFAIRPNDQVNDSVNSILPWVEAFISAKSTLVTQFVYAQALLKGAGFQLFVAALGGDPYFWQLAIFFHFSVALLCFNQLLRIILPGQRLFRTASLLFFSSSIMFKFNQASIHAVHTYSLVIFLYLLVAALRVVSPQAKRTYMSITSLAIFSTLALEPKIAFFICAAVAADTLWRLPEQPLFGRRNLTNVALIASAIGLVFAIAYMTTGLVDVMTHALWRFNNPEKIATWLSSDLQHFHQLKLWQEFGSRNFAIEGLRHGANRIFGGLEFLAAHLLCLAYIVAQPKRFADIFRSTYYLCTTLLFTGMALSWWQANDGVIRYLWMLEPVALLLKCMLFGVLLALLTRRPRAWVAVVGSLVLVLTARTTQSLVSPGWLNHVATIEERSSLAIKNYPYKVYDLAKLAHFFMRGSFLAAHTDGCFPPGEPFECSMIMDPGTRALVLNFFPAAHVVPGGIFQSELDNELMRDYHQMAFVPAERAYEFLKTTRVRYLYLDGSSPFFNLTVLMNADLFKPSNLIRYYEVARRGHETWLLRLKHVPSDDFNPEFLTFYERFYSASKNPTDTRLFRQTLEHSKITHDTGQLL